MSKTEARHLTEEVRTTTNQIARLMRRAWEEKVWKPLGYDSFKEWLEREFGWSHTRGYQLINIALMEEDIRAVMPLPEDFTLSDLQTREIISFGAVKVLNRLREQHTNVPPDNAALLIRVLRIFRQANRATEATNQPKAESPTLIEIPRPVAGGERNTRTALSRSEALFSLSRQLPAPHTLTPATRTAIHEMLLTAEDRLRERLNEFNSAIEVGVSTHPEASIA